MDSHSIAAPEFWQNETSFLLEAERATVLAGLPCPSVVFATSGSTGIPRRIALSKTSLLHSAAAVNAHLGVDEQSVWGLCLPWWHVGGFGVIARAVQSGCGLAVSNKRWQASEFYQWLCDQEVTHLSLVPTQVHDLVSIGFRAPASLVAVVVGGGRLEQSMGQAARDLGWPVLASYGMTEAGSQIATQELSALTSPYASEPLPILSCWNVRSGDGDRLEICGNALFHGEMLFEQGEWQYRARVGDWYATQDCGVVGVDGLRLMHRADSLVKVLGELVNPAQIESALEEAGMPTGRFVVIALPDMRKEHRLVLVHECVDASRVADVLEFYHHQCCGFERIDECFSCSFFPRTALGKVLRQDLLQSIMDEKTRT